MPRAFEAGVPEHYWTARRILVAAVVVVVMLAPAIYRAWITCPPLASRTGVSVAAPPYVVGERSRSRGVRAFNMDDLRIPEEQIVRGGPPKDGIPALSHPRATRAAEVDYLDEEDRVIGLEVNGDVRAYPIRILIYHELVNDTVGGVPVAVIYCPLCDSVSVVDRRVDGEVLEFGISGLLHNSNVLMFDRTDDALWTQLGMRALSGPYAGRELAHLGGWEIASFAHWRGQHPDAPVLSIETGHRRDYRLNPYEAYFTHDRLIYPVTREDDRLPRKTRIIGVRAGRTVRAYPLAAIRAQPRGLLREKIDGGWIVLSAAPDGGSVRLMEAPDGAQMVHTFWFAWAAFYPETDIHGQLTE